MIRGVVRLRGWLLCVALVVVGARLAAQTAQPKPGDAPAPPDAAARAALAKAGEEDHQRMMEQLGIRALRPGPAGDPKAPNHANYDEALANPYPDWPNPLVLNNGKRVMSAGMWREKRRPELVEMFEREVYGRIPANMPSVRWTVTSTAEDQVGGVPVAARELNGAVDNSAYPAIAVNIHAVEILPKSAAARVPVLIMLGRPHMPPLPEQPAALRAYGRAPQEALLRAGWGLVTLDPASIQADNGAGLTSGIIGLMNHGQHRKPDDWGALRAWSWGAARVLDWLETDPKVDAKHVGIEGVSRYGKAALVTLAFEQRFAMGLIGSSGEGGAKPNRRNFGEAVESLTAGEYYWMAGNFMKYGASDAGFGSKTAGDIPVDSEELMALCAPRLTFISYGSPDHGDANWLDQRGSYMAAVDAQATFRLLGATDMGVPDDYRHATLPPIESGLLNGKIAWRQHNGGHTDIPNIPYFIAWADHWIGYPRTAELPDVLPSKSR